MKKSKIMILIIILVIGSIAINRLDKKIRYKIGLIDYYRYNSSLTEEENELIRKKDFLAGIYNYPPLAYTNEYNNYNTGIVVDYLSQLAIELGGNIHIKAGPSDYLIDALKNEEIDITVIENTGEQQNRNDVSISQPLCVIKAKILVKKDSGIDAIRNLNDKVLVTLKDDNIDGRIDEFFKYRSNVQIIEVENIYQCFALLNNNAVAGFVGDDMEISHFLNVTNRGANYKFLEPIIYEKEISLAVKDGNNDILSILNKGILKLKKKNLIAQTQYKWLGKFDTDGIDIGTIEVAYKVLIVVIFIIGAFSSWNYIITQRVNTKTKELSESKEELRLIINTMQSGIMVIENNSTIVVCNDAISEITDIPKENLIGFDYKSIKALNPFVDKDNMDMVLNVGNAYYYATSQKITSAKSMIIIEDYTEKYLKEKKERQESKMIAVGQLSAGLAHEIRNPLGLIKSYSYIIEKHKINEMCGHAISVINDSVNRINKLIENLLRFSRLSNDDTKLINIEILVNSVVDMINEDIKQKGISIISSFSGQYKKQVLINKDVIRMILINLINNSIDSFEGMEREKKDIYIRTIVEKDKLNIKIIDNGCGIEKEKLDNIFDPFYSTKETGTGLGLYIISNEIFNNNGRIAVESNFGQGTAFDIVLPIMG